MGQTSQRLGKYELIEEAGRGGFSVVYKARDTDLDRIVALKVLAPHLTWDPAFAERFRREARAAAGLHHPNIVTIYEAGEEDGQLYIAMEFLERTLAQVIAEEGALSMQQTVGILAQVADALDYAHEQGVIHRDVKASNIMVDRSGAGPVRATLMDFGLVKAMEEGESLTSMGKVLGSPEYMAPEQAEPDRREEIGPATDRYALGVVAYEMLTGRVPFGGSTSATLHSQIYEQPPDPRSLRTGLPTDASPVLLKALSKAPADRYPTASAMVGALRRAGTLGTAASAPATASNREAKPLAQPALRRFGVWAIVGLLAVALLVGGVWLVGRLGASPWPAPTATRARLTATSMPVVTPTPSATHTRPAPTPTSTITPRPTATHTRPAPTATSTVTPRPTATPTRPPATATPRPTATHARPAATSIPVVTTAPTLSAGATRTWPRDNSVMVYVSSGTPPFWMDRTEVTNAQYQECVQAGACSIPHSSASATRDRYYGNPQFNDYPVIHVDWYQADAYCRWAGKQLPTEKEWIRACGGTSGGRHAWGDWEEGHCNSLEAGIGDTTPVGRYSPQGDSPYGCADMAGNAREWTASMISGPKFSGPVIKGGSWKSERSFTKCVGLAYVRPEHWYEDVGFRCLSFTFPDGT
jgi:serine/threonine-protein kinase